MNFCEKCDNLYGFVSQEDDEGRKTMSLRCQACGNQRPITSEMQVYARQFVSRTHDMPVDPDLRYDHALPRTSLVKCLNDKCPTNQPGVECDASRASDAKATPKCEVATYQYNSESGKLGYICQVCLHYWKNL